MEGQSAVPEALCNLFVLELSQPIRYNLDTSNPI